MKQDIIEIIENQALELSESLKNYYKETALTLRASTRPHDNSKTVNNKYSIVLFFYRNQYLTRTFRLFNTNGYLQVEDLDLQGNDQGRFEDAWKWVNVR